MNHNRRRKLIDKSMRWVLRAAIGGAAAVLLLILGVITWRGLPGLSWEMISQPPEGSFYPVSYTHLDVYKRQSSS